MIKKWSDYIKESKGFKSLSNTKLEIGNRAKQLLDDKLDEIFVTLHNEFGTESGDISPEQQFELGSLQANIIKIMVDQVHQNLGEDFKKIKTTEIDVNTLFSLTDERNSVKMGDEVIAVYFDGGYSIYKFDINYALGGQLCHKKYGNTYTVTQVIRAAGNDLPGTIFNLEQAKLVVLVDTYNDFTSPEKRIE